MVELLGHLNLASKNVSIFLCLPVSIAIIALETPC